MNNNEPKLPPARSLRCHWMYLLYIILCFPWPCLFYSKAELVIWTLFYSSLCCLWTCLSYRSLCCHLMNLFYSSWGCPIKFMYLFYSSLCCLDLSILQQNRLPLSLSVLQRPVLLLDMSMLSWEVAVSVQGGVGFLDPRITRWNGQGTRYKLAAFRVRKRNKFNTRARAEIETMMMTFGVVQERIKSRHCCWKSVLQIRIQIRIRIRIHRNYMILGLLDSDPDPLFRGMDPAPALDLDPDPSKNSKKNLDSY